ncbi:uncharacterized protein LOC121533857 isoform X1 [Coregonus clupeaformis]|uniref:uncharacterized protein LOC121533857 isoform X1 n=1 Tax=Coregonus clupeaformis TaxID=59861 RepID=UPI001BDFE3BC|nr:uncharacterized protein LOC121533857 isoform X1 [Coregonus clupeaformis]
MLRWAQWCVLNLVRLMLWLLALAVLTVLLAPALRWSLTGGDPEEVLTKSLFCSRVWTGWQEGLSLLTLIISTLPGMAVLAVISLYRANRTGLVRTMTGHIRERWVEWTGRLNSYLWDIEDMLEQEQCTPIGVGCSTKSRRELDHLDMLHRVDKGHLDDQDEMVQRFLDNGMKFRGYRNYLMDTMKNCEALVKKCSASVTEEQPEGDPALLEQLNLVAHILQQEQKNLDIQIRNWTWD